MRGKGTYKGTVKRSRREIACFMQALHMIYRSREEKEGIDFGALPFYNEK